MRAHRHGYTFVELMVVLLIVGVFFAFVAPRLTARQDSLPPESELLDLITARQRDAVALAAPVFLFLDLDRQRWWVQDSPEPPAEQLPDADPLPEGCSITRIVTRETETSDGFLAIRFSPDGTSDLAFLYCTEPGSGRRFTVLLNPYSGPEVHDGEVSFAEII